jgi:hypothetical protein
LDKFSSEIEIGRLTCNLFCNMNDLDHPDVWLACCNAKCSYLCCSLCAFKCQEAHKRLKKSNIPAL